MLKYIAILAALMLPANTASADWQLFPALYDVTGVASDDLLNVREGTSASYPIIETLSPNDRDIEIVQLSADKKWGLIGYPGGSGWASMRYLARQPDQDGRDLPRPLNCGGSEPFWSLNFDNQGNAFNEPGEMPRLLPTIWQGTPEGMAPVSYGIKMAQGGGEVTAIISRNSCSDGMSENESGFEINAILTGTMGNRMLTGCCSLGRP